MWSPGGGSASCPNLSPNIREVAAPDPPRAMAAAPAPMGEAEEAGADARPFEYAEWLATQEYFDDLRFANHAAIRYRLAGVPLVLAQNRLLGKGGIVWDAAFMLADHMLRGDALERGAAVVELGAGAGLAGIAAAACRGCHVTLTDRKEYVPLLEANIARNRGAVDGANGRVEAAALEWTQDLGGIPARYRRAFDVVLAADCVADIYDAPALLHTTRHVLKPGGRAYVLSRVRLPEHIEGVIAEATALFGDAELVDIDSDNRSTAHILLRLVAPS